MAETLAVTGAILLLLAVTGGIRGIATKFFQKNEFVTLGDRVAATLLGGALILLATMLETGYRRWGLWIALGAGAVVVLRYAAFLWLEDRRTRRK